MNQDLLKKFLPHIIAYVVLGIVAVLAFKPYVFDGKVFFQYDLIQVHGMQHEMREVIKESGEFPLWTNSMFSGMPTYQILFKTKSLLKSIFDVFLWKNGMAPPHTALLVVMMGFYLLLVVLRVDWRVSLLGAIAFGLSANFMDLLAAGHATKVIALAYMGPVIAGVIIAYRGKYLLGGAITAFFLAMEIYANHFQITFYLALTLLVLGIVYLIDAIRKKTIPNFAKASVALIIAAVLGISGNVSKLWTTYEYAQETIRGKSELSPKQSSDGTLAASGGLTKDYAFSWSYGILETYNLLIPNFMGGNSSEIFANDPSSATRRALMAPANAQNANALARQTSHYWGDQPFVGGPIYMGAVLLLLFFLGTFLYDKGPLKNWIIASVIFTLMLAWGKNFAVLNYFLFDNFPMFNKFRAVSMALGLTNFFVALLAILGLQKFLSSNDEGARKKALYRAGIVTGGLIVLALLLSYTLDYGVSGKNLPADLASALQADRAALLRSDALRSLVFAALGFGALYFHLRRNNRQSLLTLGVVGLLALADVWGIGGRFVNDDIYKTPREAGNATTPQPADEQIMADKTLHYRVADFRGNPFANAITSYFHKSTGGYHAAKLMRYQQLIERYLGNPNNSIHIYGMLNAKYFINQNGQVSVNPNALGNAWFVQSYDLVPDGDAEISGLANLAPKEKALIQQKYAGSLEGLDLKFDSTASIQLTSYHPDKMVYQYSANSEQLAVFSEVYYPPEKGWKLYLDGEPIDPIIKANFLLRAARLPAGQNRQLEMRFEPRSYYLGERIAVISSIIVLLLLGGGLFLQFRNIGLGDPVTLPTALPAVKKPVQRTKSRVAKSAVGKAAKAKKKKKK